MTMTLRSGTKGALAVEAVAEYDRCLDAAAIRVTCEEFRAATIDLIHAMELSVVAFGAGRLKAGVGSLDAMQG